MISFLQLFFLWCFIFNSVILILWFLIFIFAHDFILKIHSSWFKIAKEEVNLIHYKLMGFYKILIITFNLIPLIVLWFLM